MDLLTLLARLLLASVFAVAGVAKLGDRVGSRRVAADFGLPAALSTPLGILLPLAELAVAVALIPTASALWGALGALALLLLFVAGIGPTWRAVAGPSAAASDNSTPPRPARRRWRATGRWRPWRPSWPGGHGTGRQARARSGGSAPFRLPNYCSWLRGFSCWGS